MTVVTRSPIAASLSSKSLSVIPGAASGNSVTVNLTRPTGDADAVSITVSSLPAGVQAQITQPGTGNTGTIAFTASSSIPAGTYALTLTVADSASTADNALTLTVPVLTSFISGQPTSQRFIDNDQLQTFMSTSFQPASWTVSTFDTAATTKENELASSATHVRLQPVEKGTPQTGPGTWDFSTLNALLDPVVHVGDQSPELQLARAPEYLYSGTSLPASQFAAYAQYAANMVKYYNTHAGFVDANGILHSHLTDSPTAGFTPITYWGIYNEPNYNGVSASDYVTLYNMTVNAMLAAGSEVPIKFVAIEMGDGYSPDQQAYFTAFAQGVSTQVDVVATHYYSTCNQSDPDSRLFNTIPQAFVPELQFIHNTLQSNAALANTPVWITENNVNADYNENGKSACNGGAFTVDTRGTSPFFAAWRPYMFSQIVKLGVQGLYHWTFDGDKQYGEVDDNGNKYLSYWVDSSLGQFFPLALAPGASPSNVSGEAILNTSSSEPSGSETVEILAARQSDNLIVMMLSNHAVANASDNNGVGAPRTVVIDLTALGTVATDYIYQFTLDANTNLATGPTMVQLTPAQQITVTLNGYGTTFLTFNESPVPQGAAQRSPAQLTRVIQVQQDCAGDICPNDDQ